MADNEKIMQFQQLRQQLQQTMMQSENVNVQMAEVDKALDELKTADGDVYKIAGTILIKSSKDKVQKDLSEEKETLDVKVKSLQKHEASLKEKLEKLQAELMKGMQQEEGKAE